MNMDRVVKATAVTSDRIDISWKQVLGSAGYRIYRAESHRLLKTCAACLVANVKGARYADRDLQPNTAYRYLVVPIREKRESGKKNVFFKSVSCSTRKPGLNLARNDSKLTVTGDAFEITWDADHGGEIVEIKQYDGNSWVRVNAPNPPTVPGLVLKNAGGAVCPVHKEKALPFGMEKESREEIVFSTSVKACGINIGVKYTIFAEGVFFCELTLPCGDVTETQGVDSEQNKKLLDGISGHMGLYLRRNIVGGKFTWGYFQRGYPPLHAWKKSTDKVVDKKRLLPIAMADFGMNKGGSFTNHLEFFIEDSPPEGASSWFGNDGRNSVKFEWAFKGKALRDLYFLPWDMGFFRTRWGMCLGAARNKCCCGERTARENNLTGARILHSGGSQAVTGAMSQQWPFNVPPVNLIKASYEGLPSNKAIDKAKRMGASVIILHQYWMRSGGSNCEPPADYIPRNETDLRRFVNRCHAHGIKVGLYMRGVEKYALFQPYFENFLKRNFDGLYVDWSSPYNIGFQGCNELHFSAFNYFLFTKALRHRVGNKGFLIAHSSQVPTMIAFAVFDAYLPGEHFTQRKNFFNSVDEACYYGFSSCIGTNPICLPEFTTEKAVAYYAGLGFYPHVDFGSAKQGPARHHMEGLWRIWRTIPIDNAYMYNNLTENFRAIKTSNRDFHATVYKASRKLILIVVANLGRAGDATLTLNMAGLGLTGNYEITEYLGRKEEEFGINDLGFTSAGVIHVGLFRQYEYRGYRLRWVGA